MHKEDWLIPSLMTLITTVLGGAAYYILTYLDPKLPWDSPITTLLVGGFGGIAIGVISIVLTYLMAKKILS